MKTPTFEEIIESLSDLGKTIDRIILQKNKAVNALRSYATCSDGCTCGDGWDHRIAKEALNEIEGHQ